MQTRPCRRRSATSAARPTAGTGPHQSARDLLQRKVNVVPRKALVRLQQQLRHERAIVVVEDARLVAAADADAVVSRVVADKVLRPARSRIRPRAAPTTDAAAGAPSAAAPR